MPGRKFPLIAGHYYHVFNRGVAKLPTFIKPQDYNRAIELIDYYRFSNTTLKYSDLLRHPEKEQVNLKKQLSKANRRRVIIHSFVLMSNHFHFELEQVTEDGISTFMSDFTNSYTRYFNAAKDRVGSLFQGPFKSVPIESEEQFLHLSRYIHLNPYIHGIVSITKGLLSYTNSSLPDYVGEKLHNFVETRVVLENFLRKSAYKQFVLSQRDYQRKLGQIRKLLIE